MSERSRRLAERVPLRIPVRLHGRRGPIHAVTEDVSRTGMRLRIHVAALLAGASEDLDAAAERVRDLVPSETSADLHYEVLGPLIQRTLEMTRISVPLEDAEAIELCCAFDEPLSVEETVTLGALLPPVAGDDEAPLLRADMPAPHARDVAFDLSNLAPTPAPAPEPTPAPAPAPAPAEDATPARAAAPEPAPVPRFASSTKHVYRAYLKRDGGDARPTLLGHSDQLSRDAVRVRVAAAGYEGLTVFEATVQFSERYGSRGGLKIMDGSQHLYTGRVRVCSMELPEDGAGDVLVTLAFERRLNPAELRRLGLASEAA